MSSPTVHPGHPLSPVMVKHEERRAEPEEGPFERVEEEPQGLDGDIGEQDKEEGQEPTLRD